MRPKALTESQRRLVEQNIGLAGCAAVRFRRSGKTVGLELDDLFSIACMGLVYGAQRYDPAVSRPGTYLYDCCQWMLLTELRHRRRKCRAGTVYSLDKPVVMGREVVTYGDLLMADADVEEEALTNVILRRMMELSTPRERIVAMMYANGATQAEIARSLGVTRSAVSATMGRLREKTIAVFGEPAS